MTSLKKPSEIERWVDFVAGRLSIEEVGELLGEIPSVVRLGGIPGYRVGIGEMLRDERAFRKYLRIYHTEHEMELFDAATVLHRLAEG